jgi:hypothetical protein
MKHLKTFENWREDSQNAWVINGICVVEQEQKQDFFDRFDHLFDIQDDELMLPLAYIWSGWVPGLMFQCPVKTKEKAIELSKEIINQLNTDNVAIAIAGGEVQLNYDDPMNCDGEAYINSGRYVNKNFEEMISKNQQIIVI